MARDRRPADDFDDEDDDRPRKRRRDDRDDGWEDEDDRPRKKTKKKGGMSTGLIVGLLGGLLAVAGLVVALVFLLGGPGTPKKAFENLAKAAENKDWAAVYDGIDKKSLDMVMPLLTMFSGFDPKFQGKTGKDLFVAVLKESENKKNGLTSDLPISSKVSVLSEEVTGDRATLRVRDDKGKEESLVMVKEDGKWKLSFAEMMQKEMGKMPKMPDFKMPDLKMPDFKMPNFPGAK
jgi:hypothetical protein